MCVYSKWSLTKELEVKRAASSSKGKGKQKSPKPSPSKPPPSKPSTSKLFPSKPSPSKPTSTPSGGTTPVKGASRPVVAGSLSFTSFQTLCGDIEGEPSYNAKTKLVKDFIQRDTNRDADDVYLLVKMLLPSVVKRVYNLQSKQIVKVFSQIFNCDVGDMVEDLDKGDVAETVVSYFQQSTGVRPSPSSSLMLGEVDHCLDNMTALTKEEEQVKELKALTRKCSVEDMRYVVRLLKNDLRMNAGAKHVLDALDPNAYAAFQASHNLKDVVTRALGHTLGDGGSGGGRGGGLGITLSVMTPVKPMLAEACKSIEMAMKKCPSGMYAEIKYDGERVQIHKKGSTFQYFSRSLKSVTAHKVAHIKDYLPKACPHGDTMILDSEVLMVDLNTGKPLPFGTLGVHKRNEFQDAACCLFIFDIIYFNGENLMNKPMQERRKLMEENVTPVKNRIMLSEQTLVRRPEQLQDLMSSAIKQGLEGLVMKDLKGSYEPGKRHWLKMKKDYLAGGTMADSADLVVLGAYYGTGNKGGLMSVFLMGVYDESCRKWKTVAKCGNGHDDATIMKLQKELKMRKINKDFSKVPSWLVVHKNIVPDFVAEDPKNSPVWEISGAEFSQSNVHTADGISIRFPRVTKIRDDKDWETATSLSRLKVLYKTSKEATDVKIPSSKSGGISSADSDNQEPMDTAGGVGDVVSDDDDDAPPPPKKKKKPVCKYGVNCYQKNPDHLMNYSHPDREEEEGGITNPLPSIFHGVKVYLDEASVGRHKELQRYIIAYDGDVVDRYSQDDATHFVTGNSHCTDLPNVPHVKAEWIWDSLKSGQLLEESKYTY
jgi:DNA ligase-3